ncbi:REPEAT-CONTAINING PROTEIN putative-RELATED [Salix purpurea]|uniref:REPEAT-CONTAINING PROTEIN putative-RELATED n=1 Tax=Salix purpurea TaxID=77065 RepID=A0A9Q0TJZ2_SALPP|nr:REPEAT-CONTAINING PROTEIN putative-RELATED [Salix purpurea]
MFAKSELVDHALKVFERMKKRDGISWTVSEYYQALACMEKLLARVCLFDEARAFIGKHRIERHAEVLAELLDRCWIHHRQNTGRGAGFMLPCCLAMQIGACSQSSRVGLPNPLRCSRSKALRRS